MAIKRHEFESAKVNETIFITGDSRVWRVIGKWHRNKRTYLLLECDGVLIPELFYYSNGQIYSGINNTTLSALLNEPDARVGGISRHEFFNVVPGKAVFVDCNGDEWVIARRIVSNILELEKNGKQLWVTISMSGNEIFNDRTLEPIPELSSILARVKYEDEDEEDEQQPKPRLQ